VESGVTWSPPSLTDWVPPTLKRKRRPPPEAWEAMRRLVWLFVWTLCVVIAVAGGFKSLFLSG
jgi:hypothetical protein